MQLTQTTFSKTLEKNKFWSFIHEIAVCAFVDYAVQNRPLWTQNALCVKHFGIFSKELESHFYRRSGEESFLFTDFIALLIRSIHSKAFYILS